MLDATIYVKALNHAAFIDKSDASPERLKRIIDYCRAHGLRLATVPDGGLTFEHDGMNPNALHILIDGQDGWHYRTCAVDTRYYEPTYETDHFWEERRAIERDYVERPW